MLKDILAQFETKRQPRKKMTPLQEKRFRVILAVLVAVALAYLLFAPGKGIVALSIKQVHVKKLEAQLKQVSQDNAAIQEQINRAQNDSSYREDLARKQYKLLQQNEFLYDFRKEDEKKK